MFQEYDIGDTFTSFPDTLAIDQKKLLCNLNPAIDANMVIHSLSGDEGISELFKFHINILSKNSAIAGDSLIGSTMTVEITGNKKRFISGIVTRFAQGTTSIVDNFPLTHYVLEIQPKLWLLTLNKNCKVFQNKKDIDIIKEVLAGGGVAIEDNTKSCGKIIREYCVQYYESDFNFASRLMEENGIFYFFKHASGSHTMVLCDDSNAYQEVSAEIKFSPFEKENTDINSLNCIKMIDTYCAGAYAATDYNYTNSQTDLHSKLTGKRSKHEIFEYPGNYQKVGDGNSIAKSRLQEMEKTATIATGASKAFSLTAGHKFKLSNHPSEKFNKSYVICSVHHSLNLSENWLYSNRFTAMDSSVIFRPPRISQKPIIYGTQPAVVTGPSGEEIYTDEFRRVKVQFYWDRLGKKDENTSCWIRVAQSLSGNAWGGLYTPRIGQEVIVNFENGDPDRPVIIGCMYNDKHMPPYNDTEATKSTLKTVSSKGEEGFNEIRFEDLKDSEEIYVHAQKDINIDIVNSRTTLIEEMGDSLTISKGSRTELLNAEGDDPANDTTTLTRGNKVLNLTEGNYEQTLTKGDLVITLSEGNENITLTKGDMFITLSEGNMDVSVKGNYSISVDGDLSISTTGAIKIDSQKDISTISKANISTEADKNISMAAKMDISVESKKDTAITAAMNFNCESKMNSTVKSGIAMSIEGVNISVNGTAATAIKGGASCQITSPSITIGGGMIALG